LIPFGSGRQYSNGSGNGSGNVSAEEAFQQFFRQQHQAQSPFSRYNQRGSGRAFYVNGVNVSHLFNPNKFNGMNPFQNQQSSATQDNNNANAHANAHANAPRSIFLHKVTIPLQELYSGTKRKEFTLSTNLFQRYKAAFRGGIATPLALQSLLYALPLLFRVSWLVSLLGFLATFHLGVPRPTRSLFYSKIQKGWKGGTKLKFTSVEPGIDVVFIIKEGKHDRFERVDGTNDLKTFIKIGKTKARKGCTLFIDPLGEHEMPITVKLKRGDISCSTSSFTKGKNRGQRHRQQAQVVTVKGKGWPIVGGGAGDLQIQVMVVSDTKAERIKRRRDWSERTRRNSKSSRTRR